MTELYKIQSSTDIPDNEYLDKLNYFVKFH